MSAQLAAENEARYRVARGVPPDTELDVDERIICGGHVTNLELWGAVSVVLPDPLTSPRAAVAKHALNLLVKKAGGV